jgi:4-amino-4-deoxy-L-arabinose transferase-like glycosyltransferase
VIALPVAGEFAVNDDWHYARSVLILVRDGRLDISASTNASMVLQVAWGSLFAGLFGFSFTALRISTLVLAAAAVVGFYLLLEPQLGRRAALSGALGLLFSPFFVHHAYSFMSDVPYVALCVWSLLCYTLGFREPRFSMFYLAAASTLAGAAFMVRQFAALLPAAALLAWLLHRQTARADPRRALPALFLPFLPMVLLASYFDVQRGAIRQEPLHWTLDLWLAQGTGMVLPTLVRAANLLTTLGLFTLPLSLGSLATGRSLPRRGWPRACAGALVLVYLVLAVVRPLATGRSPLLPVLPDVLSVRGFLGDIGVFSANGRLPESIVLPMPAVIVATVLGLAGGALLLLTLTQLVAGYPFGANTTVTLLYGALAFGALVAYMQVFDRYLLALLPSALLLALLAGGGLGGFDARVTAISYAAVGVGLALLAGWSLWWEREFLERQGALWQAGALLVQQGVPAREIDGGYEWNGWYRGDEVLANAVKRAARDGSGRRLDEYMLQGLAAPNARWALLYAASERPGRYAVRTSVQYWHGQLAVGVQRL